MLTHPLLSLGFVSPAMLAWGVAIALPVLVHLWRRRHSREEYWGTMQLLEEAIGRSRRRLQIERGFLLLLRMILILLLVLAVAEPVSDASATTSMTPDARVHRVVVIDGSFSMAYQPTDRTRFDRAKELVQRIVKSGRTGDGYSLILAGSPTRTVIDTPVFKRDRFAQVVDQLRRPDMTLDPLDMLAQVQKILLYGKNTRYKFDRTEVYLLSDFCRIGWSISEKSRAQEYLKRMTELGRRAMVVAIDLGQPDAMNRSITSLRATPSAATVGRPIELRAEMRYFGPGSPAESRVELLVDGRTAQHRIIQWDKERRAAVSFIYTFTSPGMHEVELRLQADQLDADNHRYLIVPVHEAVRVLLVDGRPHRDRLSSASGFLAMALASGSEVEREPTVVEKEGGSGAGGDDNTKTGPAANNYRVETIHENALAETNLAAYDTVLLADVAQVTADEAKVLDRYVRQGGELLLFLGDQVMTERYNQTLGGLLPAKLGLPISFDTPPQLDPLDYRHPIVHPFRSHPESGLLTIPVQRMIRLVIDNDNRDDQAQDRPETQIVLATEQGDPLIVERRVGAGRVVLVATSADTSWTHAPIWPSFVPLVQKMTSLGFESIADRLNLRVSDPISGPIKLGGTSGETSDQFRIVTPGGQNVPPTLSPKTPGIWTFARTDTSGVYTLQESGQEQGSPTELFAVNLDPVESDLAKLSKSTLQNQIWPGVRFLYRTTWEDGSPTPPLDLSTMPGGRNRASRNLLLAALLLLALETCWIVRNTPK